MQRILKFPYLASLFLLAYMPFHIFLSQWLSSITGGLEIWKAGKDVLLIAVCLFTICLVFKQGKADRLFKTLLGVTFIYGSLHLLLWIFHPDLYARSAMIGTTYNVRLLLFALLGMSAVLLWSKFVFSSVMKWVLLTSSIVATLGVIQYFLPPDTMAHFGYSLERGARPFFAIDDHPDFPRIMSTLREPNALGAYLILPLTALTLLFFRVKDEGRKYLLGGAWLMHLLAVFLTFSRSAWLAATLAIGLVFWWQYKAQVIQAVKKLWPLLAGGLLVIAIVGFTQRNTHFFQQYVAHSNSEEQVADLDSNEYHSLLVRQGLEGVRDNPLGHGPGTAGIVSIQNPGGGQLTENYYIQIAYEVGIVGLGLFLAVNFLLYVLLWRRRDWFGLVLCASFWAYVLTNMLLHTWSNEAVTAQWWILAGMAVAASATSATTKRKPSQKRPKRA